jgi:hypothetical protein
MAERLHFRKQPCFPCTERRDFLVQGLHGSVGMVEFNLFPPQQAFEGVALVCQGLLGVWCAAHTERPACTRSREGDVPWRENGSADTSAAFQG